MNRLITLAYFLTFSTAAKAGSHSLYIFATYVEGETQLPKFSAVVMLDDVQVGYYDSTKARYIRHMHNHSEDHTEKAGDVVRTFLDMFSNLQTRTSYLKHQLNSTGEIHVHQRVARCELLDNDTPGDMMTWDAFNGLHLGVLHFSFQERNIQMNVEHFGLDGINPITGKWRYTYIYHPVCIDYLKKYLQEEKNRVMRKVKPRLRLLKKSLIDSGKIRVTCLVTGFYPRHINLTLLKDGQPEDEVTGGILLPNGDDTYQMRKSLEVDAEEERTKRNYTCLVTHLGLDNKLDISFGYDPDTSTVSVVSSILVVMFVLMVVLFAAFIARRRRRKKQNDRPSTCRLHSFNDLKEKCRQVVKEKYTQVANEQDAK